MISVVAERLVFSFPSHAGVSHDSADPWFSHWNLDVEILIPFTVLTFFYLRGLRGWTDRSREHPIWKTICYFGGWSVLLLAVESPIDFLAERHFFIHMIQHELLIMVGMPLTLLGAPVTPVSRGLPGRMRKLLISPVFRSKIFRTLRNIALAPIVAGIAVNVVIIIWHVPDLYNQVLFNGFIHRFQHVSFLIVAWLFWWNIIDPKPLNSRMGMPLRAIFIFLTGMPKHVVGAFLVFSTTFFYTGYLEFQPVFSSVDRTTDQLLGGMIMWVGALSIHLTAMGIVFFIWMQRQRKEQEVYLRELRESH
ncbi:MAG: cytochrome c oxidase assembly protein [Dehalococcoidia bacterium]|jgi:cytochrome c oxidase assembly factor CtaG|nr:cytochrome c oxidase assembly protein [Dehalococcoidia bacterium]